MQCRFSRTIPRICDGAWTHSDHNLMDILFTYTLALIKVTCHDGFVWQAVCPSKVPEALAHSQDFNKRHWELSDDHNHVLGPKYR